MFISFKALIGEGRVFVSSEFVPIFMVENFSVERTCLSLLMLSWPNKNETLKQMLTHFLFP